MKNTALFFNGDYQLQKPITYKQAYGMPFGDVIDIFNTRFSRYRNNLGTYMFTDALARNLNASWIVSNDYEKIKTDTHPPKTLVTTWFHMMTAKSVFGMEYWQKYLDLGVKIVPLSAGFSYNNAEEFGDETRIKIRRIFEPIAERNEIGVRDEKSADLFNSLGIKNVRVVGCPSLFYYMDRAFNVASGVQNKILKSVNTCACFSYAWGGGSGGKQMNVVNYFLNLSADEEINVNFTLQQTPFKASLKLKSPASSWYEKRPDEVEFLLKHGRYFFSVDDWVDALKKDDFSIGTQFHGTVGAILAGVPALCVAPDDRVRFLCKYHKIPYIDCNDFDKELPLRHYYELANYTEFNKNYAATYDNFIDYCRKNDVDLNIDKKNIY